MAQSLGAQPASTDIQARLRAHIPEAFRIPLHQLAWMDLSQLASSRPVLVRTMQARMAEQKAQLAASAAALVNFQTEERWAEPEPEDLEAASALRSLASLPSSPCMSPPTSPDYEEYSQDMQMDMQTYVYSTPTGGGQ